ncbi:MAG: hypothetical protein M1835_005931, partial [Candelina submexicana]
MPFLYQYGTCKILVAPLVLENGWVTTDTSTWQGIWDTVYAILYRCLPKPEGGLAFSGISEPHRSKTFVAKPRALMSDQSSTQ